MTIDNDDTLQEYHRQTAEDLLAAHDAPMPIELDEDEGPVVVANEAGSREINLVFPLKIDGKRLNKVRMRMPEQGDIDDFASGDLPTLRDLLCRLTGLHPNVIKKLKWQDSEAVHQTFKDVLPTFITEGLDD